MPIHRYDVLEVWWKVAPNTPPAWGESEGAATGLQGGTNRLVEIGDSDGSPFGLCAAIDEFAPWPLSSRRLSTDATQGLPCPSRDGACGACVCVCVCVCVGVGG